MSDRTDDQLLRAYARGQDSAFEELVDRHGAHVKSYALRLLRSREQAEEIYEETFLRIIQGKGSWEARGTVRGFLFTVAHRLCLDVLRDRKKERDAMPSLIQMSEARQVAPSPEAAVQLGERAAQLETALGQLAEKHRDVLLLRAVHGLSAEETAEALEIATSQVYDRLSYARKKLAALLAEPATPRHRGKP